MKLGAGMLVAVVRAYQLALRPILGAGQCRYAPSCSEYGIAALHRHGAIRGGRLAVWRVLRCNPWMPGGYDPVPGTDRG